MRKYLRVMTGRAGFTLIEMVVTLSIFSVLVAIAIPTFTSWLPGYKLKSAARDVFSNMQLAKLEAIKRNSSCTFTIDNPNQYTVTHTGGNKVVRLSDYDDSISFINTSTSPITFTSRGFANPSGSVLLTNTQNTATYTITITSVGNISLPTK
jgi:prepilin-type N-terminal cleavage/methylation domain-containing protein